MGRVVFPFVLIFRLLELWNLLPLTLYGVCFVTVYKLSVKWLQNYNPKKTMINYYAYKKIILCRLTEDWPNTYSFSKAVAEETIRIMADDLPICIVKPPIGNNFNILFYI